ncbi:MAG: cation-transporting P-type ATPase, partial [Acidimicrobiia bacterium]|nr:cation-transporting P-type ATPase [Acidimicrobiia bacterium]
MNHDASIQGWAFWAETAESVAGRLDSGVDGLTDGEAARRLELVARESSAKREPWWKLLLSQFTSPIVLIL